MIPLIITKESITIHVGVKYLPIVSITEDLFKTKIRLKAKYIIINKIGENDGNNGCIVISKVVAAVLGIPSIGPIAINKIEAKIIENLGPILDAIVSKVPSPFKQDNIANSGNPTPVIINPSIPIIYSLPIACPKYGGKIKFPAPKNIANSAKPIINISLFLLFILSPPSTMTVLLTIVPFNFMSINKKIQYKTKN